MPARGLQQFVRQPARLRPQDEQHLSFGRHRRVGHREQSPQTVHRVGSGVAGNDVDQQRQIQLAQRSQSLVQHGDGRRLAVEAIVTSHVDRDQPRQADVFVAVRQQALERCSVGRAGQGVVMKKLYVVRLTDEERETLNACVKKLKGSSQKVKRAQILLKADIEGPNWTDAKIAEAFGCRTKTVEIVRQRLVTDGFEIAFNGKKRDTPQRTKTLDGEQEAKVIATRLGEPPKGFGKWTLRLLAKQVVELGIVDSISAETVRKTLKKTE